MPPPTRPSSDEPTATRSGRELLRTAAAPRVAFFGDAIWVIDAGGVVHRLDGASGELARALLAHAAAPQTREDLVQAIAADAETSVDEVRDVVHQAIAMLRECGAIVSASDTRAVVPAGRIVLAVTGAAAAVHTPALALALERRGWTVEIALSRAARKFVPAAALTAITHRAPHTSAWPASPVAPVPHVALAAWADLVLVCPASATTIARLANGDFSDLVSAIALTTRAPVVLVPSMNPAMRAAPALERNLARCAEDGHVIVHGARGVEIAERPGARAEIAGAAPPPDEVAAIVDALHRSGALTPRTPVNAPTVPAEWDELWRATPEGDLPWTGPLDAALLDALPPPPGSLLDVGCGSGALAAHAATLGYQVVAIDVSDAALALAARRDARVVWLRDDVTATSLAARFDVVVDRGCLHVLPKQRRAAWAAAIHRLAARLVLVTAFADLDPAALLGEDFVVLARHDTTIGRSAAVLTVLSRASSASSP